MVGRGGVTRLRVVVLIGTLLLLERDFGKAESELLLPLSSSALTLFQRFPKLKSRSGRKRASSRTSVLVAFGFHRFASRKPG